MVTQDTIDKLFAQVESIEKKQEESRKMVVELKGSIFIKLAKEMLEDGVDQFDDLRFHLFAKYLKVVQNKSTFWTDNIMRWPVALDILCLKYRNKDVHECLNTWSMKGRLKRVSCGWAIATSPSDAGPRDMLEAICNL